ncbi:MAG: DUF559 domain-containing protein [Actinomycetota bacterium]|nr:DUF559 domain-containing protein [Actinomycetota bacterium]
MRADWQKTAVYRAKSANGPDRDELAERIARSQRQLIRSDQLRQIGFSDSGIQHRVSSRRLFRLHAGVYATHPPSYTRYQHYLAATYACGPGSLLTGLPSAWIYGLIESAPLIAEVTNPSGRGRSRRGITVYRRAIDPRDATTRHGIPTTSVARTIIDCAYLLGAGGTEELIMAADSKRILNRRRLEELTHEHRGRPGSRHILSLIAEDPVDTRSRNEHRLFSICRQFKIPLPLTNHRIDLGERHFYADFLWPGLHLIVEADSWRWHGGRQASENDADRDQLLAIAGFHVVHFTRDQIRNRRAETGRRLVALTAQ